MNGPSRRRAPPVPRRKRVSLSVDPDGRVTIPADLARRCGLEAGAELCVEELDHHLLLHRPVTHLAKVYVEPTTECPFSCRTCMRNAWETPNGQMEERIFARLVEGLEAQPVVPAVFIGGIGEPLSHPGVLDMARRVKAVGAHTEMISNGLLLDERTIDSLIDLDLDTLWVSMDGATEECYGHVRENAAFPRIVENLHALRAEKYRRQAAKPELGIAFVSMRRNREELSRVIDLGLRHGATKFSISNVQPHVEELRDEVGYGRTLGQSMGTFSRFDLARMDSGTDWDRRVAALLSDCGLHYSNGRAVTRLEDTCPFLESGSLSVRWDGMVSPCLPLLHSHTEYLGNRRREIREHFFGSLGESSLSEIWNKEEYVAFRRRLQEFDFPPCLRCNACDSADSNQEDCFGSPAPTCGACAWAQGFIVCP